MAVYTISDLHLSLDAEKSMEVFNGWEGYVEKLKKNWKFKINENDTVVIIGDISWAMKLEEAKKDLEFLNKLPGKKILLKGNHDFWWSTSKKVNNFLKENNFYSISILHNSACEVENLYICGTRGWMCRSESDVDKKIFTREVERLRRSIEIAELKNFGNIRVFLHYPPVYGKDESEEIINLLIEKKIKKCYYGHIHGNIASKKIVEGDYKGINFSLVSCDYINFCPVLVT